MTSLMEQLRTELESKNARTQAGRFVRLTAAGFAAQTATLGTSHLSGHALAAALVGVVEMAWRQWAPTVPWSTVAAKLHLAAVQQATAPAPAAAVPGAPAAPKPPAAAE
ncbi:hypothetical protein [Streptacidiphilus sp. MAP5-3]|uniref:hypothetical protein n=1 Tax=unclassified Streptacidiphilus TaxID=2643834 RepID=UPI003516F89C